MTAPEDALGATGVLILADESAGWRIAGLRQLDRLALALDAFSKSKLGGRPIDAIVHWTADETAAERWMPGGATLDRIRFSPETGDGEGVFRVLSTRMLLPRDSLAELLTETQPVLANIDQAKQNAEDLLRQLAGACASGGRNGATWSYLANAADVLPGEKRILRATGKRQDGLVARLINRPISRTVSRQLLKLPISPTACTLGVAALALVGLALLVRGDYWGFVAGTGVYQLVNILDGCDGEIARCKYLESDRGLRIDALADLLTNLLFIICLGLGLFRLTNASETARSFYLGECLIATGLIGARVASYAVTLVRPSANQQLDRRDGEAILSSTDKLLGERLTALAVQLTKRDVIFFGFFLLAVFGLPQWIGHIVFGFAVVTLILRLASRPKS